MISIAPINGNILLIWNPRHARIVELTVDNKPFAKARVDKVVVKRVKELTDEDAKKDGFNSREELIEALKKIYGNIKDSEFVTIVHFTLV